MTVSYIDISEAGERGPSFSDPLAVVAYIDTLRSRPPFMFELDSDTGYELMVGLANEMGFAQFSQLGTGGPFFMTVDPQREYDQQLEHDFLAGGVDTPIDDKYCISYDKLREVVLYFAKRSERNPNVNWEML